MTTPTTGALWKSPALRACVAYEATQKPEVECEERKEHESPPVALHTEEEGDEEDPRREKGAHTIACLACLRAQGSTQPPRCSSAAISQQPSYAAVPTAQAAPDQAVAFR